MKMGSLVVAVVMAMMVMSGSVLPGAQAQGPSCLNNAGAGAAFSDATAVVQQLRVQAGQCCQSNSGGFCTVLLESGNAAATICGPFNYCPNCADVGNDLNQVLAICNQQGQVQGVYSPDGTSSQLFYLTSASNHP